MFLVPPTSHLSLLYRAGPKEENTRSAPTQEWHKHCSSGVMCFRFSSPFASLQGLPCSVVLTARALNIFRPPSSHLFFIISRGRPPWSNDPSSPCPRHASTRSNPLSNRILSHSLIHARLLDPANLPPLLRGVRAALFPNNAPGKSSLRAPTSDAELASLRRRCAAALWGLVPRQLGRLYFGVGGGGGGGGSSTRGASGSWWRSPSRPNEADEEEQAGPPGSPASRARSGPTDSQRATSANLMSSNTRSGDDPGLADSGRSAGASASGPLASRDPPAPSSDAQGLTVEGEADDAGDEQRILGEIESGIIDVFGDSYCNKHLVYGILELVLVRLMPELAEKGVIELWEERLN